MGSRSMSSVRASVMECAWSAKIAGSGQPSMWPMPRQNSGMRKTMETIRRVFMAWAAASSFLVGDYMRAARAGAAPAVSANAIGAAL